MTYEDSEILWRNMPMWIGYYHWYLAYHGTDGTSPPRMDIYPGIPGFHLAHVPVKWWLN